MKSPISKLLLASAVAFMIGSPAGAAPLLDYRTTANIGGSGFDAIDFFYESSPTAEFTNYYLDFGTSNGSLIYDPLPGEKQDVGGDAIDTFMNTVGSLLGVGDASHIHSTYRPGGFNAAPASIDRIEWDVFDVLADDTNDFQGNVGSYHLARVLVQPNAMWHATFKAFDTATAGIGAMRNFTNDSSWTFPQPPPVTPITPPPPIDPGPVTPPPVTPNPPTPLPPSAMPMVTTSTVLDLGGSGLNAIDFYYSNSTPTAEFTNYRLNFRTEDGAAIHDPIPGQRYDAGGDAVDTFMNTVGSLLDLGSPGQIYSTYNPAANSAGEPLSKIDWDVYDMVGGDTNSMAGGGEAPYHLARVLVSPDARWNATFTAFDTNNPGIPAAHNFTNDPNGFTPDSVPPPVAPPHILPDPVAPPPVDPGPVAPPPTGPIDPTPPTNPPERLKPALSTSTVLNVGGSGLNAIDFYYSSSPGAEFTNYNLKFRTDDSAAIHDPLPGDLQDAGGDAVDTFMNTVGSLLDLGNASHIYTTYNPNAANGTDPISKIEWDVFDTLGGDTNTTAFGEAPYHLARILVSPDATWNATFTAFDTNNPGIPTALNFSNDPNGFTPEFVPPPIVPEPVVPDPGVPVEPPHPTELPPPVDEPGVPDVPTVDPVEWPPLVDDPPADEDSSEEESDPVVEYPPYVRPLPNDITDVWYGGWYEGWYELVEFRHDGIFRVDPAGWLVAVVGTTDVTEFPLLADDRFLMPTINDGTTIELAHNRNFTTFSTQISALLFATNGLNGIASDSGVPEPSSALLASLALASLAATARRRRS